MRRKRDLDEEIIEVDKEEKDEVEEKKARRREGVEKRKSQKKRDRITRWSGFILLLLIVLVGFLLWVVGEMGSSY
jgi:cytoskeletal protein RodZ